MMKILPTENEVLQSQSSKLYLARFLEVVPLMHIFLNDQKITNYNKQIDEIRAAMKTKLLSHSSTLKITDPDHTEALEKAKADIDSQVVWAKEKIYWLLHCNTISKQPIYLDGIHR